MKLKLRAVKLAIFAVAVFGVIYLPGVTQASNSWGGYHWARKSNPFTLKVGNNVTSTWTSAYNTALSDWTASSVMDLSSITGTAGSNCSMVAGTVQVCNKKYGNNGWLGLASINITGGVHITQGTAKMNDTYFSTSTYNNPNEKLHVMCQEIGHTFGLDHQSTSGASLNTCMDYFSNTGANAGSTVSTHPNSHDYAELVTIYTHLDSTTTLGFPISVLNPFEDRNAPENWGKLVGQSKNGRSSDYERENWDGSKDATQVYWTIEAANVCRACDHRYDH